jgi:hypothetical protein
MEIWPNFYRQSNKLIIDERLFVGHNIQTINILPFNRGTANVNKVDIFENNFWDANLQLDAEQDQHN